MSWWHTATREQRLAQCRGGAEAGLAACEIGLLLGASSEDIAQFCKYHGVRLRVSLRGRSIKARAAQDRRRGVENEAVRGPLPVDRFIEGHL